MPDRALRILGTSVTLPRELQARARKDLGFEIEFQVLDGSSCLQRGVTQPQSFDIYDQWFHSIDLLHTAGSIMPIDIDRIERWNQMEELLRTARSGNGPRTGAGLNPADVLFVQDTGGLGSDATGLASMLPTAYNADAFAYRTDIAATLGLNGLESWSWLIDRRWPGRCLYAQDPASSVVELALAAQAGNLIEIDDCTNLTIEEIDALFALLLQRRKAGHAPRFWATHEDSVRLMAQPSTVLGALWSPAYFELRASGVDLTYASPKEGYRGWHSGMSLSAALRPAMSDRAYEYLNWWLSGVPGALLARQGYYMSVTDPLQDTLTEHEWAFWYEGKSAAKPLPGLDGRIVVNTGDRRDGGSFRDRVSRIAVWSTIMDENNHLLRKWLEFVA